MGFWKKLFSCLVLVGFLLGPAVSELKAKESHVIGLQKVGGVYHLPVQINGFLERMFILDTGAAEMSLPSTLVKTLIGAGTIREEDILEEKTFILADGNRMQSPRVLIHKVKIGNRVLRNIPATVGGPDSPPLIGQNLLEKIGSYSFDSKRQVIVLHSNPNDDNGQPIPVGKRDTEYQPVFAPSQTEESVKIVEKFFLSVAAEEFDVSWKALSTYSQNAIIGMVSEEAEAPPEVIRRLFEQNHRSVQEGFWSSFRDSSRIPIMVPMATYHQIDKVRGLATVKVQVGTEELHFEVYEEEDGNWKLGLIESIQRFHKKKLR